MSRVSRTPRNSIVDRPRRWRLLLRRHSRFARRVGLVAIGLSLVALAAGTVRSKAPDAGMAGLREKLGAAAASLGMRVREVRIEGRANTPEPLLRAAIGVSQGDPILGFSVEAARARIETLAWVEYATVERRLPVTIVVHLQERRPFAIWQNQGRFVLIDREGQVVTEQNVARFGQLPLVVGPGAPAAAAPLLDALTERPALQSRVIAAVRIGERRWNLRMNGGTDVMLPEGAEVKALDRLLTLQQEHALLDRPIAAVDMRLPDRLVVHPQADSTAPVGAPRAAPITAHHPT